MMKKWYESPIDMNLVKKITNAMRILFNVDTNFNYHMDQILVLKIIPIAMKDSKHNED